MTAIAVNSTATETSGTKPRRAGFLVAWLSSAGAYLWPRLSERVWTRVSVCKAVAVGIVNLLLGLVWWWAVIAAWNVWDGQKLFQRSFFMNPFIADPAGAYWKALADVPLQISGTWGKLQMPERFSAMFGPLMATALFLAMLFFMLVPFAARPGRNKACVLHVIRTVMLGTGFVHFWSAGLVLALVYFAAGRYPPGLENIVVPLLGVCIVLVVWAFSVLVCAAKREYRAAVDYPQPHDPTCDLCGYNLLMAPMEGRCPECGKPVSESLGEQVRLPTEWERAPRPSQVGTILRQLWKLVRRPQSLFVSMPTLSGQAAAHRWLLGTLVVIVAEAFWIIPSYAWTGIAEEMEWPSRILGGLAIGIVWAGLALMMVGIETAGIATFSRMKGNPVMLSTAAKVTCYAAILMLPWVVLGGAQLLGMSWWWGDVRHASWGVSIRTQQILTTGSMAIAHIGGLLWFEFTVYSGIRRVQWANK